MMDALYAELFRAGKFDCTAEEKEAVFKMMQRLMRLIRECRQNGLLWLDIPAEAEENIFLRSCLRYIVHVTAEPEEFRKYAAIWLMMNAETGRVLEMAVIIDALEYMLRNESAESILRRLGAWLGADYADKMEEELHIMERQHTKDLLSVWQQRKESLEAAFDTLSKDQLLSAWKRTDLHTFAIAITGAGGDVIDRLKQILSAEQQEQLLLHLEQLRNIRSVDAQWAQKEILYLAAMEE